MPGIAIEVSQKDIARVTKRLDNWTGTNLRRRAERVAYGAMSLFVSPLRAQAARHNRTGATQRSIKTKKLRKRPGEAAAWRVGPTTWYKHFVITGTNRGIIADPYVDEVREALTGEVLSFYDEQIRKF